MVLKIEEWVLFGYSRVVRGLTAHSYAKQLVGTRTSDVERGHGQGIE